jgi:hypothetical protein
MIVFQLSLLPSLADKWMGKTGAVVTFNYAAHPMKINSTLGYFAFKLFLMGLHVSKRDMDLSGAEPKGMISIEANANPQPVASKWAMVQVHFAGARFGGGNGPSTSGGQ